MAYALSDESRTRGRWYMSPRYEAHDEVRARLEFIRRQQDEQRQEMRHFLALYSAGNVSGVGAGLDADSIRERLREYLYSGTYRTRFNMSAAVCDTAHSMVAQTPAVPQYLTTGGDFSLMRKAEKRSQVLQSQMNNLFGDLGPRIFLDACKVGSGFVTGYLDENELPVLERVHALELFVEHADGINGKPRSIHRVRLRSREVLKSEYPKFAIEIERAPSPSSDAMSSFFLDSMTGSSSSDMVEVIESHHLRSTPKKKRDDEDQDHDGRHTVCLATVTLLDESWGADEFPYVKLDYRERDFGYFGSGLIEASREAQLRVNDLIARVARGQDIASTLIVANPNGEKTVSHEQFTNELGLILNYDPVHGPPQLMKWDGTLSDLQQQIDLEFERVLAVEGLSEQQVNGEGAGKGLTSGVAVRAADDVQSRRLVSPTKRYQSFCIGVAKLLERLNDEAAELGAANDNAYEVRGKMSQGRKTFLITSKWADLHIPEGHADIVMAPMSALPTTPQGKWAAVQEWIGSGFVSRQYAMSLLQFPDLDSYADIELAHLDMVQWQIEQILDGKSVLPNPRQDLAMAMDLMTKSLLKAIMMKAGDEIVDSFESFLVRCGTLLKAAQPKPVQVPMGAPMMGPQGPVPPGPGAGPHGPRGPMQMPGAPPAGGPPVMMPRPPQQPMRPGVAA